MRVYMARGDTYRANGKQVDTRLIPCSIINSMSILMNELAWCDVDGYMYK